MAYLQLGDVASSAFNCTKYPGICKPSDTATLQIFKNLQAQLNRIAQGAGLSKISVDGDIGAGTVALMQQVAAWLGQGGVSVDPARNILMQAAGYTSIDLATHADMLGAAAQGTADQMSVPPQVPQPSSGTSTLVSASGAETKVKTPTPAASAGGLSDLLAGMDTTTLLAIAAGAGALIYFGGKPKRGRARASSRHARSRR